MLTAISNSRLLVDLKADIKEKRQFQLSEDKYLCTSWYISHTMGFYTHSTNIRHEMREQYSLRFRFRFI